MKLTVRQNQVLEFVQDNYYNGEWFQLTHEVGNTFVRQYGQGDIWRSIDNLVDKRIIECDNRKIDSEYNGIKSHCFETWYRLTYTGKSQIVGRTKLYKKTTGPVTSKDPRKKAIAAEMKKRSGGTRVTNVKETKTHFTGRPMKKVQGGWENLPVIAIEKGVFTWRK